MYHTFSEKSRMITVQNLSIFASSAGFCLHNGLLMIFAFIWTYICIYICECDNITMSINLFQWKLFRKSKLYFTRVVTKCRLNVGCFLLFTEFFLWFCNWWMQWWKTEAKYTRLLNVQTACHSCAPSSSTSFTGNWWFLDFIGIPIYVTLNCMSHLKENI